jgi:hypothetical protein
VDRHGRVADGERGEHLGNDSGLGFNQSSQRLDERSCDGSTASDAFLRRIAYGAGASPQSLIVDRLDPRDRRSPGRPEGGSGGLAEPARATPQLRLSATQLVSEPGDLRLELRAARLCPGDGNHMTPIRAQVCHGCAPFGVPDHAITAIPLFGSLSQSK